MVTVPQVGYFWLMLTGRAGKGATAAKLAAREAEHLNLRKQKWFQRLLENRAAAAMHGSQQRAPRPRHAREKSAAGCARLASAEED
jgi:hypothetical protein